MPALVATQDDDDRLDRDGGDRAVRPPAARRLRDDHEPHRQRHPLAAAASPTSSRPWRDDRVDPALAVDELLRHDGPVQFTQRVLLEDYELDGHGWRRTR